MMEVLLIATAAMLAFSNGANDNFKGFATVWGSNTLSYRRALTLASIATVLGGVTSLVLAETLLQQFSGHGLVPDRIAGGADFMVSVGAGAAATVLLATRFGFPISTTHALIGALVGAGFQAGPESVDLARLARTFLLPLIVSPILAGVLGAAAHRILRLRDVRRDCACVAIQGAALDTNASALVVRNARLALILASDAHCDGLAAPVARMTVATSLDRLHILSAASICFARGVNDTPKLTALLIGAQAFNAQSAIIAVVTLMMLGGLLFARRVARTMSLGMVRLDHAQGLAANLITAGLVLLASNFGLPVSTTHVAVGSIAGVGMGARTIDWRTTRAVLLSWVVTLPTAASIAYTAASLL